MKNYALKKSLSIFLHASKVYKNKQSILDDEDKKEFEFTLSSLQQAINEKDKRKASAYSKKIEALLKKRFPLSNFTKIFQSVVMLGVALFFAIIIRQTCFEFMEIPSGSMRPTFRECDRLIVSKAQFGINIPLSRSHFLFSPDAVKRMNTIVLTSKGMDVPNSRINYFHIFPGYKQFVKRLIGRPEDSLYFYGGKIYGVDKDGNDISPILQQDLLSHIEHIPYIYIAGRSLSNDPQTVTLEQNHIPIASLKAQGSKGIEGKMLVDGASDIHELWGMGNYAMSKIIPSESLYFSQKTVDLLLKNPEAHYFLEITHHPSIKDATATYSYSGKKQPTPKREVSYIPLTEASLKSIWNNLYTARFESKKGYMQGLGRTYNTAQLLGNRPKIKGNVPDGAYEFFDGVAYNVKWQNNPFSMIPSLSIPEKVNDDHPFAKFSESKCVTLYNMGIEQSKFYVSHSYLGVAPARYAYYRDGDLYLMGKKIFDKDGEILKTFITAEQAKLDEDASYIPFIDQGAPLLADGSLDIEKVKSQGLFVPKKSYYVLGDNHAQSGDSREFGFVPEENLRGVASFMLWAPGGRFGPPLQQPFAWFTIHKLIVWFFVLLGVAIYYIRLASKFRLLRDTPLSSFIRKDAASGGMPAAPKGS